MHYVLRKQNLVVYNFEATPVEIEIVEVIEE